MTASSARWPIWVTAYRIRRWVIFCAATGSLRLPRGARPPRGRTLSPRTWLCWRGADFFTVEVLTWRGLVTYYVLFFLHLESRRVSVAGITRHPDQEWMEQIARSATQETWGYLDRCRYVRHDRDTKFCTSFRSVLAAGGVKTIPLPARSPNLNAFAKRWVGSVKEECLSKLILFGEG